jgi:hypothetical protein
MLGDLVAPRYAEVNASLADESGYICSGKKDQSNREVLD